MACGAGAVLPMVGASAGGGWGREEGVQHRRAGPDGPALPPGLLWQLRPSDVEVELLAHTRRLVSRDLPEETGLHTGWVQNGGLFIASSRQRLLEYQRLMSVRAPRRGGGAPLPAGAGAARSRGGVPTERGSNPAAALAGRAAWDRWLCLSEVVFVPVKWDRVAEHSAPSLGGGRGPVRGRRYRYACRSRRRAT